MKEIFMKRFILLLTIFTISTILLSASTSKTSASDSVKGVVVYDGKSDYHIVETSRYYVIVEWYSGPDFSKNNTIYGELHSYGFKYVKVNGKSEETKVYIENYWS